MTRGCWRGLVKASTAALLAAIAVGCGEQGSDLPEPADQVRTPPTPSIDPEHQPILTAYESYLAAWSQALHVGDPDHPDLTRYAGGAALRSVREDIEANQTIGARYDGRVTPAWADVMPIDDELPIPDEISEMVRVDACLDVSDFIPVRIEDGSSMLAEDAERGSYLSEASLAHYTDDDRWVVVASTVDWEEPC